VSDATLGLVPGRLKEIDFQRQLVSTKPPGLAVIYGWEHIHFKAAMTKHGWRVPGIGSMSKGWPDLTLVRERDGRLVFAELKGDGGRLTDDEKRVLAVLDAVAAANPLVEVYRWWPKDLDEIARVLR
jgi:hypothetical protein